MALFSRFFSPRRNQKNETNVQQTLQNKTSLRSKYTIERDEVRVLLFRECDWRGRKLLFDSSCVQKVAVNNFHSNGVRPRRDSKEHVFEINNGFGYKYTKLSKDATTLGETIFGSVALSQRRSSIKVHLLNTPRRMMLSSVIHSPRTNRKRQISDRSLDDSYGSSINSLSDYFGGSSGDFKSCSGGEGQDSSMEHSVGNCDNVAYCPIHCSSLPLHNNSTNSTSTNQSGGSLTSLRRRWLRSVMTSMNLDSFHNSLEIDPLQTNESNSSNESTQNSQSSASKRTKLGVAVVIKLEESQEKDMEEYLLQRIPLLIHLVTRLQQNSERAYALKDSFVQLMMEATDDVSQAFYDMLCGVCIENPYWLTLADTFPSHHPAMRDGCITGYQTELISKLLKDLGYLLQSLDTKHTNFFMSTLITAVLTHHLGWVPTVVPEEDDTKLHHCDVLSALSQSHPYNPLWAQLSDLQGALGFPPKIAKTVIVGRSEAQISKVLSVLTYFIRCGRIFCTSEERLEDSSEDGLLETVVSSKLNLSKSDAYDRVDKDLVEKRTEDETSEVIPSQFSQLPKPKNLTNLGSLNKVKTIDNIKNCIIEEDSVPNISSDSKKFELANSLCRTKSTGIKRVDTNTKLNNKFNLCSSDDNLSADDLNPIVISDKVTKLCRVPKSAVLCHINNNNLEDKKRELHDDRIFCKNNIDLGTFINLPKRIESEKQMGAVDVKNHINRTLSFNSIKSPSIINNGTNPFRSDDKNLSPLLYKEKSEKPLSSSNVIFILGENENLVGLKNINSYQNLCKLNTSESETTLKIDTPAICIENCDDSSVSKNDILITNSDENCYSGERFKSSIDDNIIFKTDSSSQNKVLIFKPTTIDTLEQDSGKLSPFSAPPLRCLSIPDEVMLVADEIKEKRGKETVEIIRRWLSDSEIYNNSDLINSKCGDFSKLTDKLLSCSNNFISKSSDSLLDNDMRTCSEKYCCDNVERTSSVDDKDYELYFSSDNIYLPLPNSKREDSETEINLARTLLGGVSDHYIPSLVLQGIVEDNFVDISRPSWESQLRRDLQIEAHSPVLNQHISEAVCIVANLNTWEVQLVSSHTLVVEKILEGRSIGVRVGMSQLVANMLETVLNLCQLSVEPKHCISHIEAKLSEFWLRSIALSEMLLSAEFLDIETLTSALDLDANDVPLLLSVASTHSPEVTKKYGLSFQ